MRKPIKPIAADEKLIEQAVEAARKWLNGDDRSQFHAFQMAWLLVNIADAFTLYRQKTENNNG